MSKHKHCSPEYKRELVELVRRSQSSCRAEAYEKYALEANRSTTYIATYRLLSKKYPEIDADRLLTDLIATTPGQEGKWFATAKALGQSERVALRIQTMLKPTTREVRWVREMLNMPASSEPGPS